MLFNPLEIITLKNNSNNTKTKDLINFMKKIQNKLIELFNRYKHVWILSYFIIYLTWFGYLERTVTTHYHLIHLPIDDYIPFCEYFVIPYIMWFVGVSVE